MTTWSLKTRDCANSLYERNSERPEGWLTILFTSAISRAEIDLDLALVPEGGRKRRLMELAREVFDKFPQRCLPFEEIAATLYGNIVASCIKSGRPISVEDAQIALIALANGLRLATRNEKEFEAIPSLVLCNPWRPNKVV